MSVASAARAVKPSRALVAGAIAGWLVVVVGGVSALWSYKAAPGIAAKAPPSWPAAADAAGFARAPNGKTLVVFAHPRCPCTRATMSELARAFSHAQGAAVEKRLVLFAPAGDAAFAGGPIRVRGEELGMRIVVDEEGALAAIFGSSTSGQALLYDEHGALRFAGGVTAARGHEGESAGGDALVAALNDSSASLASVAAAVSNVFGCSLRDPERAQVQPQ